MSSKDAMRRPSVATPLRALRRQPAAELLFGAALAAASALWAARSGTLSVLGWPVLGAAVQAVAWATLFVGLGLSYRAIARSDSDTDRRLLRLLGLSIPLALLTTYGTQQVLGAVMVPRDPAKLVYARWLLPAAFTALWCIVLLPRETRALVRMVQVGPFASLPPLALLLATSAVLVSCADLAFIAQQGDGSVAARLHHDEIWGNAWLTNILLLFSAYVLAFAITRRVGAALLLVSPPYVLLAIATLAKIRYMHSAVQPLDLLRLPEFFPLFRSYFGTGAVVAGILGGGAWIAALAAARRAGASRLSGLARLCLGLGAVVMLVGTPVAVALARSSPALRQSLSLAGIPTSQRREQARRHGILLSFLAEVPWALVGAPPDYSPASVARALGKYTASHHELSKSGPVPRVNLIVYLVESFMDPMDLGYRYTSDPMPHLRALRARHGDSHAVVPGRFGGSANTEFEVLTGMASSLLPEGSVPYRQYVRRPIPSLPRALEELGYATTAIQADPRYYYNRERVYGLLGFDHVVWLRDLPGVERAPRGGWPSDQAVVRSIIQASRQAQPFFIFAFPSSTHGPHNSGVYRESDLTLLDPPAAEAANEVHEYVNAVRVADDAIRTLIDHFEDQSDSTMIVVLSDHLPPLSSEALRPFFRRLPRGPGVEHLAMTHRVPLLVWANFDLPREEKELGVHALPAYLLEKMGIIPQRFFAVAASVGRELPVLASYVRAADGRAWDWEAVPADKRALIEDYRLLQYDLLLGEQFALDAWAPDSQGPDAPSSVDLRVGYPGADPPLGDSRITPNDR
jgi:hypothetical protein